MSTQIQIPKPNSAPLPELPQSGVHTVDRIAAALDQSRHALLRNLKTMGVPIAKIGNTTLVDVHSLIVTALRWADIEEDPNEQEEAKPQTRKRPIGQKQEKDRASNSHRRDRI